jgi:hypothetical protein
MLVVRKTSPSRALRPRAAAVLRQFLQREGFLTETGEVAEPYRSTT